MWPTHGAQALVLIVDDNPENLTVIGELLHPEYTVRAANGGRRAIELARRAPQPDLILLDVMMPDMDGFAVLQQLRADPATAGIPVIFLTALDDADSEAHALRLGAGDFITKPIRAPSLLARVRTHVALKQARDRLQVPVAPVLPADAAEAWSEAGLVLLMQLAARCHPGGQRHLDRVAAVSGVLAEALHHGGRHAEAQRPGWVQTLRLAAPLHDIGNAAVPERILGQPGRLSEGDWNAVRTHTRLGADALRQVSAREAAPSLLFCCARDIALSHHERWDGRGYPDSLSGAAIPLPARVVAVADTFSALLSPRPHRRACSVDEARVCVLEGRGRQFDPAIVDLFEDAFDTIVVKGAEAGADLGARDAGLVDAGPADAVHLGHGAGQGRFAGLAA
ncbi:response regulator [Ideonella sp. DXS22W]|uniref:Response regulator n=1 Tax=Pseudaquabacterium inlustre TaxID=2984192 RepID=A0ABU9CP29_9BURK